MDIIQSFCQKQTVWRKATGTKDSKVLLMKTDQNGEEQWISTFMLICIGYSVQQTNDMEKEKIL